jgi:hypothetical protein
VRLIAAKNCKNSESPSIQVAKRRKSMNAESMKRKSAAIKIKESVRRRSDTRHIDRVV